jgi:hypothetical protein
VGVHEPAVFGWVDGGEQAGSSPPGGFDSVGSWLSLSDTRPANATGTMTGPASTSDGACYEISGLRG